VVAPEARLQNPLQQSASRPQTSPGWMHHEEPSTHLPLVHRPEQQLLPPSAPTPQGFPAVAQAVLSGWHVPLAQSPLQQDPELVQFWLSAMQLDAVAQVFVVVLHCRLQQSVATAHELPDPEQLETDAVQVCITGSQAFEQHCPFEVQAEAVTPQMTFMPPVPVPPLVPPDPVPSALTEFPQPATANASAAPTIEVSSRP
jgi:hypothetical protein